MAETTHIYIYIYLLNIYIYIYIYIYGMKYNIYIYIYVYKIQYLWAETQCIGHDLQYLWAIIHERSLTTNKSLNNHARNNLFHHNIHDEQCIPDHILIPPYLPNKY